MTNENEVYSLRQLEAFNALSQNEKLKIQQKNTDNTTIEQTSFERKLEIETIESEPPKTEVDVKYSPIDYVNPKDFDFDLLSDNSLHRVFIATQLNGATIKANPKAVTASVFKTLPSGSNPLKHKLGTSNNVERLASKHIGSSQIQKASTASSASSSSFMKTSAVDACKSFGKIHSTISEPSVAARKTVVTASFFQPRRETRDITSQNLLTADKIELGATEIMNKSYCMPSDETCKTTCKYFRRFYRFIHGK